MKIFVVRPQWDVTADASSFTFNLTNRSFQVRLPGYARLFFIILPRTAACEHAVPSN